MATALNTDLRQLRQRIITCAANAGEGHIPSALSILDIVYVLHNEMVGDNSRLVLSKGHGCLALYVVLMKFGRIPDEWLDHFCEPGAELLGHPERRPDVGIEATTGSLGHGIGMACGLALAERISGRNGRVFCLVGDGECEEGSVWESAHLASRHKLDNLVVLVDANGTSPNNLDGTRSGQATLCDKFRAFGWNTSRINGHDHPSIRRACQPMGGGRPFVIVADTKKGYGCEAMEREPQVWHHRTPSAAEFGAMLESVR